jgi:hypothetical protein
VHALETPSCSIVEASSPCPLKCSPMASDGKAWQPHRAVTLRPVKEGIIRIQFNRLSGVVVFPRRRTESASLRRESWANSRCGIRHR